MQKQNDSITFRCKSPSIKEDIKKEALKNNMNLSEFMMFLFTNYKKGIDMSEADKPLLRLFAREIAIEIMKKAYDINEDFLKHILKNQITLDQNMRKGFDNLNNNP